MELLLITGTDRSYPAKLTKVNPVQSGTPGWSGNKLCNRAFTIPDSLLTHWFCFPVPVIALKFIQ